MKWMKLEAKNTKQTINSLSLAWHNDRVVDVEMEKGLAVRGRIGEMFDEVARIGTDPHGIFKYSEITDIRMAI